MHTSTIPISFFKFFLPFSFFHWSYVNVIFYFIQIVIFCKTEVVKFFKERKFSAENWKIFDELREEKRKLHASC